MFHHAKKAANGFAGVAFEQNRFVAFTQSVKEIHVKHGSITNLVHVGVRLHEIDRFGKSWF